MITRIIISAPMKIRRQFFTRPGGQLDSLEVGPAKWRVERTEALRRSLLVGEDAQVLDGLSAREIVTGAAKRQHQVLAQVYAVSGSPAASARREILIMLARLS